MRYATGDAEVDRVLRGLVGACERDFPGRVRAYYLTGSWADGTAVRTPGDALHSSDVDLTVVFKGAFEAAEPERFRRACAVCEALGGLGPESLDATARDEAGLFRDGSAALGATSRLLLGEDVRGALPPPAPGDHARRAARLATGVMAELRGVAPEALRPPLGYPDPAGEFFGYDFRDPDPAYGGHRGTRLLVIAATWGATALLAARGRVAGSKAEAVRGYRQDVGGPWAGLVAAVYERCKLRWGYRIPDGAAERRELREVCRRMLGFEDHVLHHLDAQPAVPPPAP